MQNWIDHTDIRQNYRQVLEQIHQIARANGRDPQTIRLVVVTKGHPIERIEQAILAGAQVLGENYLEEALPKLQALQEYPGLEWRMIGHVQSRKAEGVSRYFDSVDSVDSLKLALRLDRFAREAGRILPVLLECNVSGEESKFGWPAWDEAGWDAFAGEVAQVIGLSNLRVDGLMTMPPFSADAECSRPYFQRLGRLQIFLQGYFPELEWRELSMGMSQDYPIAIQEGATQVRIGTAIMGPRR